MYNIFIFHNKKKCRFFCVVLPFHLSFRCSERTQCVSVVLLLVLMLFNAICCDIAKCVLYFFFSSASSLLYRLLLLVLFHFSTSWAKGNRLVDWHWNFVTYKIKLNRIKVSEFRAYNIPKWFVIILNRCFKCVCV